MMDFLLHWAFMVFVLAVVGVVLGIPLWALGRFCDLIDSEAPIAVVLAVILLISTAMLARDFQKFHRAEQRTAALAGR